MHRSSGSTRAIAGALTRHGENLRRWWWLCCLVAGGLQAASLAWPWALGGPADAANGQPNGWLQIASLAVLVLAMQRSNGTGQAFRLGWLFATTWLVGTFWWLFVSMHTYGGLPAWAAMLAVLALAAALALPYAAAVAAVRGLVPSPGGRQAALFVALWTLAELVRGHWFTGFPWGAGGYAQVDLMAAWAPWVGVYGMGLLAALLACALVALVNGGWRLARRRPLVSPAASGAVPRALEWVLVGVVLVSITVGAGRWQALAHRWTVSTGSLNVWLLQGNIAQDEKFEPGTGMAQALAWYPGLIADALQAAQAGRPDAPQLVVAPETAIPLFPHQLKAEFWQPMLQGLALQLQAPSAGAAVNAVLGLPLGGFSHGYTNSVWGITPDAAARALSGLDTGRLPLAWEADGGAEDGFFRYDKHHLVPFGEFIPPLFRWFIDLMNIPLGDFSRGALGQPAWPLAGQRIAPNICYEDLFGEELAASFRDPAQAPTVLVNLSNIGWFGDTVAIDQHLHISRLRAMELGRPMLRATNTGATAAIDHLGRVTHQLPRMTRGHLPASVEGREGLTPYAQWVSRWRLWPLWGLCLAVALAALIGRRAGAHPPAGS